MGSLDLKEIKKTMSEVKAGVKKGIEKERADAEAAKAEGKGKKPLKDSLKDCVTACFGKAIKAQKFGPALFFILTSLCVIGILCSVIIACCLNAHNISYLFILVPASVAGLFYFSPKLSKELAELAWFCDNCSSDMDVSFEFVEKNVEKYVPTKKVITGSHYEFSNGENGNIIAKEVVDSYTQTGIAQYKVKGTVKVMLKCKTCGHQQEFVSRNVSLTVKDPERIDNEEIKKAILKD